MTARRDARVLRDFARMCTAMQTFGTGAGTPTGTLTFGLASGLAEEIAAVLETRGLTMAEQADSIEREVAAS